MDELGTLVGDEKGLLEGQALVGVGAGELADRVAENAGWLDSGGGEAVDEGQLDGGVGD